ncbi:MAG: VOC family protein [Gemmatimonadota bacterium]|nr:VOC family protein [Gemmatimonadota bacterium]
MTHPGITPPNYRLPDDIRLGHVSLQISDMERSLAYYENVLGLRLISRNSDVALLGTQGSGTPLVELQNIAGTQPVGRHAKLGLYHFAILLPNRATLGRFVQHLVAIGTDMGAADHLVSEALYLRDPDGLGIEVYADRPRDRWRVEQQQLVMATDPLDMAGLVSAANGAPWKGMPDGTVMGHVHLHVGDLDHAAAFYHAGLGLDKMVWQYPGALFMSAGGYHHHLGVNTWAGRGALSAGEADARLLEWRMIFSSAIDMSAAAASLQSAGQDVTDDGGDRVVRDPWGTQLRLRTDC